MRENIGKGWNTWHIGAISVYYIYNRIEKRKESDAFGCSLTKSVVLFLVSLQEEGTGVAGKKATQEVKEGLLCGMIGVWRRSLLIDVYQDETPDPLNSNLS